MVLTVLNENCEQPSFVARNIKGYPRSCDCLLERTPAISALKLAVSETGEIDSQSTCQVATSRSLTSNHIFFEE
jgi:hypothetical protein